MKNIIRKIKGTNDILPDESLIWIYFENYIRDFFQKYGYKEIRTPIFESTELFLRSIGKDTDIVSKEMYSWVDQGNNNLTLRPELTASFNACWSAAGSVTNNTSGSTYERRAGLVREPGINLPTAAFAPIASANNLAGL